MVCYISLFFKVFNLSWPWAPNVLVWLRRWYYLSLEIVLFSVVLNNTRPLALLEARNSERLYQNFYLAESGTFILVCFHLNFLHFSTNKTEGTPQ